MEKEDLEIIVFDIVNAAGTAKGLSYEALKEAENGNYEKVEELLKEADKFLLEAHNIQTEIIKNEVSGNNIDVSVLFVHAQDHLMTSIEAKSLIECMIKMYKRIENLENGKKGLKNG